VVNKHFIQINARIYTNAHSLTKVLKKTCGTCTRT
jgi:hypothetical protein